MNSAAVLLRPVQSQKSGVVDLAEGVVDHAGEWPLIPDATYTASLVRHVCIALAQFRGQPKVFLHFRLQDAGQHTGKVLFRAYRVRTIESKGLTATVNGSFTLHRGSDLLFDYVRLMDVRARPDRVSLRAMRRHLFRIQTRTVAKDRRQRDLPEALRYSVVDEILAKETS